jgi:hypothetical protein
MLDSFWPIEDKEEGPMVAKLHLSMNFGPQYQPTKVEVEGTREEIAEYLKLDVDATHTQITERWAQGHAYAVENFSPGKG